MLERFAKRALEESEEDGRAGEHGGPAEGKRAGESGRGRGSARGRGGAQGGSHGDGPPRKKVMTETGGDEGVEKP